MVVYFENEYSDSAYHKNLMQVTIVIQQPSCISYLIEHHNEEGEIKVSTKTIYMKPLMAP